MKSLYSLFTLYTLCLLSTFLFNGCWSDENKAHDEPPSKITFQEKNDFPDNLVKKDNTKIARNFAAYTYIIEPENLDLTRTQKLLTGYPAEKNTLAKTGKNDALSELDQKQSDSVQMSEEGSQISVDLSLQQKDIKVERPPLFSKPCLSATNPAACSEEAITSFINGNLRFPDTTVDYDKMGSSQLIFRVTKAGEIENISFRGNTDFCVGCVQAAKKFIQTTSGDWSPALHNGQPVHATVTIPLQFTALK